MAERKKSTADELETILGEEKGEGIFGRARAALHRDPAAPKPKQPAAKPPAGHPNVEEIGELVALANLPVAFLAPRDSLTPLEQAKLIQGLHDYADKSDPARRFMYALVKGSALIALAEIGMGIALPRLIRHGVLPVGIAPHVEAMCDASQLADACGITMAGPGMNGASPDAWSHPADIPAR